MRIADTDPDELDDNLDDDGRPLRGPGSRRRKLSVMAGAAVVIAGGITAAVAFSGDDDDPAADVSKSTVVESSDTTGSGDGPAVAVAPSPDGFPDYGSDYMGPQLDTMFQRTTDTGIRLVLQNSGDWQDFVFEGDTGFGVAETIAIPVAPPGTGQQSSWIAPQWCSPIGGFRLAMSFKDAIGIANGSRYGEPRDGLAATLFSSGYAEGVPFRALVLNLGDDVLSATATWADDASDTAVPVDGWVVLATPGEASGKFELVLQTETGERTVAWDEIPQDGDLEWQKDCSPPPPELPLAGGQPDDPAGAEAQIRANYDLLYDLDIAFADKAEQLLDDTTGVLDAIEQMREGGFADAAETSVHTMTDLVFVSPNEAWFTYDLETQFGGFANRFGIAYLIDGEWRFARAVVCQDLSLTGIPCNPPVNDIYPAVG
ncbi:MAG: hypothetical protein K8R99_12410 [Actinomycetia bacterium]|nr:hypothetical protein [Actinomycetes bacterium]